MIFNTDDRLVEGQGINSIEELPSLDAFDNFKQAMTASFDKFTMTSQLNSGNRYYTEEFDKKITELKTDDPIKQKWLGAYKSSTDPNKSLFERLDKEGRIAMNDDGTLSATDPYSKQYTREFADQVKGYFTAKNLGLDTEAVRGTVQTEMGKRVKETEEVLKKTEGAGGVAGEIVGTAGGFLTDPFGLATLPLGTPVRGAGLLMNAAKAFGQEFAIGAATEAVSQGASFKWKNEIGMKHELADAFFEVAVSGAAGGLIRSGGSIAIDTTKLAKMDWNLEAFDAFDRITYGTKTQKQVDVLQTLEKIYDDKMNGRQVNVSEMIDDNPTLGRDLILFRADKDPVTMSATNSHGGNFGKGLYLAEDIEKVKQGFSKDRQVAEVSVQQSEFFDADNIQAATKVYSEFLEVNGVDPSLLSTLAKGKPQMLYQLTEKAIPGASLNDFLTSKGYKGLTGTTPGAGKQYVLFDDTLIKQVKPYEQEVLGGKSMWAKADEDFTQIEMPAPEKVLEIEELGYNTSSKAELEAFDLELQNIEKGLAECL